MAWKIWQVLALPQGKQRRDMIVALLEGGNEVLAVNCKYRPQLNEDADLRYLIKKGILKPIRMSTGWFARRTYLVLNK